MIHAARADYYASYARTSMDGYRQWSAQQRDRVNLHGGYQFSSNTDARVFYFFAHVKEELPGALTRAQFETDPRAADAGNVTNRWGRDYNLHHVGLQLRTQISPSQRLEISPYMQYRDIDHPIFEVISQISHDYGAEVRYENTAALGALANRLTVGIQPAYESLLNHQYVNNQGEHGALTKNQHDRAKSPRPVRGRRACTDPATCPPCSECAPSERAGRRRISSSPTAISRTSACTIR